jgi:non-specific serine/threonine protein kinase
MLESLREFAADRLQQAGETGATARRHADHFAVLALDIERRVGTGEELAAIEEVGREVGNLREALAFLLASGLPATALSVASALGWYCYTRGQLGEGQATLDRAIAAAAGDARTSTETMASAMLMVGAIALARGDVDIAEAHLRQGLRLNEGVGSVRVQAIGTAFLGHVARALGRAGEAVARHTEAGRLHEESANHHGVAWSRYDLGLLARRSSEPERAGALLRESLRTFRELHYPWAVACSAVALATVELGRNRVEQAAALLGEALTCFEGTGDLRGVALCLEVAARVACGRDAPTPAAHLLGAAGALRSRLQAPVPEEEENAVEAIRRRCRERLGADAAADAETAGSALSTASAAALARQVGTGPGPAAVPPPRAALAPGVLTPREAQVADLVRTGRTNRQMGRQLGISEKTVEVHVHNIIRKLGASSRAEIAAWAATRG